MYNNKSCAKTAFSAVLILQEVVMKRFAALIGAAMMFAGISAFAADSTPVKLSLIPNVGIPE